uniref:Bridge-like lipid transfer protein family member 1 C-terminal domain-containing protein n=1 Tax=Ascaris suum TaxID=6253 RepID=F1KPJ4_ASCSU
MNRSTVRGWIGSAPFWQTNGSLIFPGDINLRWEDYKEIVQPDKASFWLMLGSLVLFIVWIVFLTFYLSRIVGPIVAFFLTRVARLKGYNGYISLGSFSISLMAGKMMFRDLQWSNCDYSFHCNDGWIIFSYWKFVSAKPIPNSSDTSRLHISLNGLQIHVYNRLSNYRSLAKWFGLERLFGSLKEDSSTSSAKKLSRKEEEQWDSYYDSLWSLFGYIKLDIACGKVIAGNAMLPSAFVLIFENLVSKVLLKEYPGGSDRALVSVVGDAENVRISLVKCSEFETKKPAHFVGRRDPPPRTMGDGFAVLQTAHLKFYYNQSILGIVKEEAQSLTVDQPVWESVWRLGKNTVISYGPWADAQRVLLYDYFFPPEQRTTDVTVLPKKDERRILLAHDTRVSLLNDAGIDLWFMRGDELNALHLRVKQGSSLDFKIAWTVLDSGYQSTLRCCLLCVESSTSLAYRKFFQCETLRVSVDAHYPRVFNAHQLWKYSIEINKISAWVVWDHKRFFTDLINEWTSESIPDLHTFIPYTWEFNVRITDSAELILALNDKNWIDTSSSASAENCLAAIVGKEITAKFSFPFVDYCPEKMNMKYVIDVRNFLALRVWLPAQSPLAPVLHSLMKNAHFTCSQPAATALPTISSPSQEWEEIWRCETISLVFDYTYYVSYADPPSDLPYHVIASSTAKIPRHPIVLATDDLLIEVEIGESEILLTGIIIKLIIDLKNNYFGLYDQLTDVVSTDGASRLYGDILYEVEYYRPLALRLGLCLRSSKAHCLVHSTHTDASFPDECPMMYLDQLMLEIVKGPLETMVQVNVGTAIVCFEPSQSSICNSEGIIALKTLSFRGHAFFSEIDVPWDAGSVEYAWLMEILIGTISGKIHPTQLVVLAQFVESLLLLSVCPDEDLQLPERYELCHHMNDIRTCPRSALNLVDSKGRIQNCESEENLKYKMSRASIDSFNLVLMETKCAMQLTVVPFRLSYCNNHEGSFCSDVLLKISSIRVKQFAANSDTEWLECAALCIDHVDVDVRLPFASNEIHLIQERRNFLLKHDKATSRLHFLWSDQNLCSCFGDSRFFGSVDITGKAFLNDLEDPLAVERFEQNPNRQPGIGQSIVYEGKRALSISESSVIRRVTFTEPAASSDTDATSVIKTSSEESFHSALSTSLVNLSHHMVCPILSSSVLLSSYTTFLSRCCLVAESEEICPYGIETDESLQRSAQRGNVMFVKKSNGVNDMRLIREDWKRNKQTAPSSLNSSSEKVVLSTPSSESAASLFGADYLALYVRGTLATNIRLFVSPLALEVTERLTQHAAFTFCSIHPAFIAQHLYTVCVFRHHSQPLTQSTQTPKMVEPNVHINVILPTVDIALFQCGLIEKTIHCTSLQDTLSHLVRSNIAVLTVPENSLVISARHNTADDSRVRAQCGNITCHAQFLQVVESNKRDFWHNKGVSVKYVSNWPMISADEQLMGYDMRTVAEFDLCDISLSINTNPSTSPQRTPLNVDNVEVHLGTTQLDFGLCKPVDQTSSKEWPLFDVFAPCLSAWTYSTHRLSESLEMWCTRIDEWIDLVFAKTLSDALDCNSDQIFSTEKSCFADVKVHQRTAASCPSCKLSLILMRYAAEADLHDFWAQTNLPEKTKLASSEVRKQALIALLSHWQTIICSQIKLVDAEVAHKYVKETIHNGGEIKIDIEMNSGKNGEPPQNKITGAGSARSVSESHQMDLYHWISARHREHKEAVLKSNVKKTLDDFEHVNPMEIVLSVFFWRVYEERNLEPSRLNGLPLPQANAVWSMNWKEVKVDVLEPKMISSSSISYLSMTRHHLLHVESILMKGHFHSRIHLDEYKVRPVRASYDISYSAISQSVRVVFALASVCLFNDLSRVMRSTANTLAYLKSTQSSRAELSAHKSSPEVAAASEQNLNQTSWITGVLDKLGDYRRSRARMPQVSRGCVQVKAEGHFSLKVVMLEIALTHLFVSTTFKKLQLSHKNERDKARVDKQVLDVLNASVQRANLILSEFVVGSDAKHIVNFSVKASTFTFKREQELDGTLHSHLNLCVGDVEGDMPIHAQNLHEVVLRNAPQLNEQMTRLEYSEPTPVGEYSPHLQYRQAVAVVHFEIRVSSIELTAQLLPSLKTMYRLEEAESSGKTGSEAKFMAKLKKHVVHFTVNAPSDERRSSISWDTFTLALPHIHADGAYKASDMVSSQVQDESLQFREGGYIDIVLTIGKLEHIFTTDLLNQVLFAEQCFRSELTLLIERIAGDRLPRPSQPPGHPSPAQYPFLFTLSVRSESAPWLQLTASTPTSTALRLTFDNISATLTNRWAQNDSDGKAERLYGKATIGISAKLGQLVKTAMFEEIETELQEFATFMTQISVQNKESNMHSSYSYVITVNRPILLIKSSAVDKAILLWLNYKNTYDYWREQRNKMLKSKRNSSLSTPSVNAALSVDTEMDVNLSLKVTNGVYVCMPLYSADLSANMSALVVSLQSTDITVCVRKELACQAAFHNFKVKFIDNFDDQALNDSWIEKDSGDPTHSNYFYFPQGTYQFVSRATAAPDPTENAKWILSVKWQMLGMIIDLDHRIGKLASLLVSTFSSLAYGDSDEEWEESGRESTVDSDGEEEQDAEIDATGEFGSLAQAEERVQWLERKMHEQSVLVTDLMQCRASEPAIEKERRKLRKLELARFKQFRKSVLDKLKRNAIRQKKRTLEPRKSEDRLGSRPTSESASSKQNSEERWLSRRHAASRSRSPSAVTPTSSASRIQQHSDGLARMSDSNVPGDLVDMDIDVQVSIESGLCTLRAVVKQEEFPTPFSKKPSARDLKSKMWAANGSSALTKLAIPSVDVKAYYTSLDRNQAQMMPRHMQTVFAHKYGKQSHRRRPAFYLAVELSSMPQESLVTPHLADFVEQMLEPLPESNVFGSSVNLSTVNQSEVGESDVPIVEMDTSALPLDVLFHLTVQSSTVRFEGHQQRSAAADCLLKLPSLTLMASTRPVSDSAECADGDAAGGGIHLSATLSAFSLNIYSPHQMSSHDALSLTLDHISVLASRSKNSRYEPDNKVQFVLTANIGSANFNYDMRRLAELISFPKPWYRRTIVRRLFFGDHSVKTPTAGAHYSSSSGSKLSHKPDTAPSISTWETVRKKEWSATVIFAVKWKELNVNAQMANTMGNTTLFIRVGALHGYCQLNSQLERIISVNFRLKSCSLSAHGGAISGQLSISKLRINCRHQIACGKPPENAARVQLEEIQSRVEWMSRPIFIGRCEKPCAAFFDRWASACDDSGNVVRASVSVNLMGSWSDLQMIITKATVDDFIRIAGKLHSFFQEQMTNSRMVWGIKSSPVSDLASAEEKPSTLQHSSRYQHWPCVLDTLTEIQSRHKILPMPTGEDGVTVVGGVLELNADMVSLACMHGEMNASSWALFHMRQPSLFFEPEAQYAFVSDGKEVGVSVSERVTLRLGNLSPDLPTADDIACQAVVCRVQQGRGSMVRQMSSVNACLEHMIGDVLKQLHLHPLGPGVPVARHSVLPLFEFPALDAILTTLQEQVLDPDEAEAPIPEVRSSFICEFHDTVSVQTDFNAQVSFLPELIKTYMGNKEQTKEEKAADLNRDFRRYVCDKWIVDPKIRFIDRFKWNPPVIDEILRKLQIFDHRNTIPKALQRGMLDPCDALLARISFAILSIAKKSPSQSERKS